MLHGFCETQSIWDGLIDELSTHHQIITVDLPGFGASDSISNGFDLNQLAGTLDLWMRDHGFSAYTVVGHSLGGYIALSMLEQFPRSVRQVVLFHSTAFADDQQKKENRTKAISFIEQNGSEKFVALLIPTLFASHANMDQHEIIEKLIASGSEIPVSVLTGYTRAMRDRPDRTGLIQQGRPVNVIAGRFDRAIPSIQNEWMQRWLPEGSFQYLEHSGHMGMFEEKEESIKHLLQFLGN
jgi:pimeloyl-ACP methyl ester carboxylesterase